MAAQLDIMDSDSGLAPQRRRPDPAGDQPEALAKRSKRFLDELVEVGQNRFPDLSCCLDSAEEGGRFLVCSRKDLYNHPPIGMINRVRIVISEDGSYDFQVIFCSKEKGTIDTVTDFIRICEKITINSAFKFCPGIDAHTYDTKYFSVIRYDLKSVRRRTHPINRIDSHKCLLWHQLAKNASIFEKDMTAVLCSFCKRLRSDLEYNVKKAATVTPSEKENRLKPSSHFPEKYLSPKSLKKKKQNTSRERINDKRLLSKYNSADVTLTEDQHDQMCDVVAKISEMGSESLETVFAEGDKQGVGRAIRAIWQNDLRNVKKEFDSDQKQNG